MSDHLTSTVSSDSWMLRFFFESGSVASLDKCFCCCVSECFKDDNASQWKSVKLDPRYPQKETVWWLGERLRPLWKMVLPFTSRVFFTFSPSCAYKVTRLVFGGTYVSDFFFILTLFSRNNAENLGYIWRLKSVNMEDLITKHPIIKKLRLRKLDDV